MKTAVWAHRGASAYAPENTLEAFALAISMGADGLELDVHMTSDDQVVVIHDETVNRTTGASGRVVDHTLHALKRLHASNGLDAYPRAKIPTLQEVYDLVRPTSLCVNVEVKCDVIYYWGIWDKLIALEREMGMQGRVVYSSFNHYVLPELRKLDPHAKIGLLYEGGIVDPWVYCRYMKANAIHPRYTVALSRPGLLEGCKQNGIAVHTWTVDDPAAMQTLSRAGVEAMITNRPDLAKSIVQGASLC